MSTTQTKYRKLAFIGAGNMSQAIINGLCNTQYPATHIIASNPSRDKLDTLQQGYGIQITQDNLEAVEWAEVIVLAVKPQIMAKVCQQIAQHCQLNNTLFISIAAGITYQRLSDMLGGQRNIIRTMPNTPSAIGLGMTGIFAPEQVCQPDRAFAEFLLKKVGETLLVEREELIDTVIAAAGSSPAYFFLFLQAIQQEAENQGLSKEDARLLTQQAMLGSAHMVCSNPNLEFSQLRAQVTSKGGTTAQAIEHFKQQGLEQIVSGAMQAAVARAKQMSQEF